MPRFSSLRRPVVAASAAAVTAAFGGVVYYRAFGNKNIIDMPLVDLKRDPAGRILPPTFTTVRTRAQQLEELRRSSIDPNAEYDLLVIGGGATGTGIALDAVTRGLKVALVERDDFAAGTSSKSTKLVHGGVRYLEKAVMNLDYPQLELVMEALHERKTFLRIAPHLSSSLPILLPLQQWWKAPYFFAGTKAYDFLAGGEGLESSYFMSRNKALEAFPLLRRNNLVGALVYYDGQHNDARMNFSLALTSALYGASVLNHVEVTALDKDANGKVCGAQVRDTLDGTKSFPVRAKGVINATGPFADAVEQMDDPSRKPIVAPASGVHVMLPGNVCPNGIGLLEASSDGRVIFVLPWQGHTLAGTTDTACEVEQQPVPAKDDVDFILKEVNKLLQPDSALTDSDVLASWSGIRPLVKDPKAKNTESLVRSHLVSVSASGLLTCAGGKWTTYRQMAEDAVDASIKTFNLTPQSVSLPDISGSGLPAWTTTGACCTRNVPLAGAHGYSPELSSQLRELYPVDADIAFHLATNYGDRAWAVLAASPSASKRLLPDYPFIEAEVRHAARAEAACTAEDLISRRLRLAFLNADGALTALPRVIDVMAEELGWDATRKQKEWTQSVHFLKSMGLGEEKQSLTREQVLAGAVKAAKPHKKELPAGSSNIQAGVGLNPDGNIHMVTKSS